MKIKSIMSRNLITCQTTDNILSVSNLMKINDVGFVLIMNKNKLYGIITDRDIVCDLSQINKPIKEIAKTKIVTTDENKSVQDSLNIMKENKIKRLVITNQNKVTGVLSLSDVLASDIESQIIIDALKEIYAINRNDEDYNTDIHDFIL